MPKVEHRASTNGSQHWLPRAVRKHTGALDQAMRQASGFAQDKQLEWRSPVPNDSHAEDYDDAFLERLGIPHPRYPLGDFWPLSGPRWAALARTSARRHILLIGRPPWSML